MPAKASAHRQPDTIVAAAAAAAAAAAVISLLGLSLGHPSSDHALDACVCIHRPPVNVYDYSFVLEASSITLHSVTTSKLGCQYLELKKLLAHSYSEKD